MPFGATACVGVFAFAWSAETHEHADLNAIAATIRRRGQEQRRPSESDLRSQIRKCNAIGMMGGNPEWRRKIALGNNALYYVISIKA